MQPKDAYYRESGKLEDVSYIVIFDCLHHDTIAVHLFQKNLVQILQEKNSKYKNTLFFRWICSSVQKSKK